MSDDVIPNVRGLLEQAFSGKPFFYQSRQDFENEFRGALQKPASIIGRQWQDNFDKLADLVYGDVTTGHGMAQSLMKEIAKDLDQWIAIRKEVFEFQQNIIQAESKCFGDDITHQRQVLRLYKSGKDLHNRIRSRIEAMKTTSANYQQCTESVAHVITDLRSDWVDFVQKLVQGKNSELFGKEDNPDQGQGWFPSLSIWSDLIEVCDSSSVLIHEVERRFQNLHAHVEDNLDILLDTIPTICFNMYGNMLSGSMVELALDIESLRTIGTKLHEWIKGCPQWDLDESKILGRSKKVHSGQVHTHSDSTIQLIGDNPSSVPLQNDQDVQVGLTLFDVGFQGQDPLFDNPLSFNIPQTWPEHQLNLELEAQDPKTAHRLVRAHSSPFYGARLSWLQVPSWLHQKVSFGKTVVSFHENQLLPKVQTNGVDGPVPSFCWKHKAGCYSCFVRHPESFKEDGVVVRVWIMGVVAENFVIHEVEISGREGFHLHIIPLNRTRSVTFGHMAYLPGDSDGFHAEEYEISTPCQDEERKMLTVPNRGSLGNIQLYLIFGGISGRGGLEGNRMLLDSFNPPMYPVYFPFPKGKFQRRPAVAIMLSRYWFAWWWNYRLDIHFAATREGVVIQPRTWWSSIVLHLSIQILAISND